MDADQIAAAETAALAMEIANAELVTENEMLKNANAGLKSQMNKMKNYHCLEKLCVS